MSMPMTIDDLVIQRVAQIEEEQKLQQQRKDEYQRALEAAGLEFAKTIRNRLTSLYQVSLDQFSFFVSAGFRPNTYDLTIKEEDKELIVLQHAMDQHEAECYNLSWRAIYRANGVITHHNTDDFVDALTFAYTGKRT